MTISDLLGRLQHVKSAGTNKYTASCPCKQNHSHDDRNQSLSIALESNKILLHCHVGCSVEDICENIGCKLSDLFLDNPSVSFIEWYAKKNNLQFIELYSYCYGKYQDGLAKARFIDQHGKKTFRWISNSNDPNHKSGFKVSHDGCEHRLYVAGSIEDETIVLVEGEKDANSINRVFGLTAVSVENGASNSKSGKKWLPEYTEQLTGKSVYIIGDNDKAGQNFVQIEGCELNGHAAAVYVADLIKVWPECPEKGDISDLIKAFANEKSKELFTMLMNDAEIFVPSKDPVEVKSDTGKNSKDRPDYKALVYDLIDTAKIRQFGKALYRMVDGKYYKLLGDIFINHELIAVRGMEPEKCKAAQTMIKAFQKEENIRFDSYYVGFKNGIMNWRTVEFFPYGTQDIPIFRYFDVNYNPDADTSFIDGIVTDWCQGDEVKKDMLYELAGCCFYADKPIKKWWSIEGKADTGKTTFLKLLRATIGEDNVGSTPIQNLKDPNAIAELIDKSVNIVDDGSSKFTTDLSMLRRIIQGDVIQIKLLYQNIFSTNLESRMVFVFNRIPRFRDDNDATAKKMLVIGFNRVYSDEEKDTKLIEKLISEENKEAFLKLAISAMRKVLSRNLTFTVSEESKRITAKIIQESDQFISFVADTISEDYDWKRFIDGKTTKDVYTRFRSWAIDEGYQKNILVQKTFTERCCKESGACIKKSNGYNWFSFEK